MFQEDAQEPDNPISNRLALLNAQYPDNTSDNFIVELGLVKILVHFVFALLSTLFACLWRFKATRLLNFAKVDYQLSLCRSRLLGIAKDLCNLSAQRCQWTFIWYFDRI